MYAIKSIFLPLIMSYVRSKFNEKKIAICVSNVLSSLFTVLIVFTRVISKRNQ